MILSALQAILKTSGSAQPEPVIGTKEIDLNPIPANITLSGSDVTGFTNVGAQSFSLGVTSGLNAPLYSASDTAFNDNPSIRFDNTNTEGLSITQAFNFSTKTSLAIFMVFELVSHDGGADDYLMAMPFNNGGSNGVDIAANGANYRTFLRSGSPSPLQFNRPPDKMVYSIHFTGSAVNVYKDRGLGFTLQAGPSVAAIQNYQSLSLGSFFTFASTCSNFKMARFVVQSNLTGTVEDYSDYLASTYIM